MSANWLHHRPGQPGQQAVPVFAGQKLVVVGGSSGMGRDTAADVVAGGGSAVIIGQDPAHMAGAATRRKQRYAWQPLYL